MIGKEVKASWDAKGGKEREKNFLERGGKENFRPKNEMDIEKCFDVLIVMAPLWEKGETECEADREKEVKSEKGGAEEAQRTLP